MSRIKWDDSHTAVDEKTLENLSVLEVFSIVDSHWVD